jgi:AcrR family transcriptional regulator
MDDVVARILERLDPEVSIPADATWQERRSAETRVAILEATIESLVQLGYARTSTTTIANYARITRGAMGHHYATKLDLITAVLDYALYKRMALYIEEILRLTDAERRDPSLAMDLLIRNSATREYRAYLELLVASRGDPELNAVFLPKVRRYRHVWQSEMAKLFPGWEGKEALLFICSDFATLLNEALVLNAEVIEEPAAREVVNRLAGKVIQMVRDGQIDLAAEQPRNLNPGAAG